MEFLAGFGIGAFLAFGAGVTYGLRYVGWLNDTTTETVDKVAKSVASAIAYPGGTGPLTQTYSMASEMTAETGVDEEERHPAWMYEEDEETV